MTIILLASVLLQLGPPNSPVAQVEMILLTKFQSAIQAMENDPDQAQAMLNDLMNDPLGKQFAPQSTMIRYYREQARYMRGEVLLRQGQAQEVVDEVTTLLQQKQTELNARVAGLVGSLASPLPFRPLSATGFAPRGEQLTRLDWMQLLNLRSRAWKELGQAEKAQADQAELQTIGRQFDEEFEDFADGYWDAPRRMEEVLSKVSNVVGGSLFILFLFVGMVPVFVLMGMRQRRDGNGTWGRLFVVAVALSVLQTLPVVAAFALVWIWPGLNQTPALIVATAVIYLVNIFRHRAYLQALVWTNTNEPPALLEDVRVLNRVEELAERMGVRLPVVRCVYSASSQQSNEALISGLVAPTLLLHDGILNRLDEEERDAIIAHELGHLANFTFGYWLITGVVCSLAVLIAASFFPPLVVIALGFALLTGISLILTRGLELDCDRRAARAIGHRRTASALSKIHADQPFRGSPWLEFFIGATSTHPSLDERLAAIHRDAPAADQPMVEWDIPRLSQRRLAAWVFTGLGMLIVAGSLVWSWAQPESRLPAIPLFLIPAVPMGLLWLGLRKSLRRHGRFQQKRGGWPSWLRWTPLVLLLGYISIHWLGLLDGLVDPLVNLGIILAGLLLNAGMGLLFQAGDRAKALNQKIAVAIQSDDYSAALDLCEANPAVVALSPELRHNHGLILAVLGEREEAIAKLEALRANDPEFKLTWLALISLYNDEGQHEKALELASQVNRDMPDDSVGFQVEAWALMKVGRLDEAEERARRALKMEPGAGSAYLTLAGVALRRGNLATARQELANAQHVTPGTVGVALLAAEIALATNDAETPALVKRAVKAARTTPLAFADKEVAALKERGKLAGADEPQP